MCAAAKIVVLAVMYIMHVKLIITTSSLSYSVCRLKLYQAVSNTCMVVISGFEIDKQSVTATVLLYRTAFQYPMAMAQACM